MSLSSACAQPDEPAAVSSNLYSANAGPAADGGDDLCSDGFARGEAAQRPRKIASMTPSPEGVTVCPNGDVFVARDPSGEVWRVQLDGQQDLWASLGDRRPAGITCDEKGRLFVATFSTQSGKQASLGPVMISGKGADPIELPQPTAAKPISGLNGIVAVPGVGVYASDTSNNNIVFWQETAENVFGASVVASDVALANGLAYAPSKRALYVNASGAWQLLQFTVAEDGALGDRRDVPVPLMLFMDGVAVDEKGDLYVADWLGGSVTRISTRRSVLRLANPASLAFRGGTLLVTDYKLGDAQSKGGLHAIDLGICGAL
ncbi:MAG TPA: SMP-30/gluconolactonase/LRE family protein [Polyangiales bacterium]|nr:SMP-30/gluconolactonase/LRE family protein [Polyangiales bacterium]